MNANTAALNAAVLTPVGDIQPYDNNPRRIAQKSVEAVKESLRRYGWQQPIVTDSDGVIVVGHTRYRAALELGYTEVPVIVANLPDDKIKEYRLVDNRTGEMTEWDSNILAIELREFDEELISAFFEDMKQEIIQVESASTPTEDEIRWAQESAESVTQQSEAALHTTKVKCPSCFYMFEVRTRSLPGMSVDQIEELTNGGAA